MKTRERILAASLMLFNEDGEAHVSTNHIADELNISPGNLYYHFRNKEDITLEIFAGFRQRMEALLDAPADRGIMDLEDVWLFLHLVYETIWEYRFLYHNLVDLTRRNRTIRRRFHRLIRKKEQAGKDLCHSLIAAGVMQASDEEVEAVATSMALVATYWLSFATVRADEQGEVELAPAVYQTLSLMAPYLREPERGYLGRLAEAYR